MNPALQRQPFLKQGESWQSAAGFPLSQVSSQGAGQSVISSFIPVQPVFIFILINFLLFHTDYLIINLHFSTERHSDPILTSPRLHSHLG